MLIDIEVPATGGEYMDAVVVVEWRVSQQEAVSQGQVVAIVETAKTTIEIEAPVSGTLAEILAQPGEEVEVGGALGRIQQEGVASAAPDSTSPQRVPVSPAARKRAQALGISLSSVQASSPSGRIKLRDLPADVAPRAKSGGSQLYVERRGSGSGTPLVFIHGYGGDALGWTPLLGKLSNDRPVVLVELPGHGRSPALPGANVQEIARQVAAALSQAGVEDGHVVGHSLGGAVAIAMVAEAGFKAESLCLLAPAGLGPEVNGEFLAGFARANSVDSLHPWLRQLTAEPETIDRSFAELAMAQRSDPQLRRHQLEMASTLFPDGTQCADLRTALRALTLPLRVIWGKKDGIIPWRHALEAGWRAGVHLLPAVGHLPHIEAPAEVALIVEELLRSTENSRVKRAGS